MTRRSSIAFRLITAVLLVELASSVLVILLAWGYERHAHFRSFEIMLRGRADSVLGAVQDAEDAGDNVMLDLADLHVPSEDVYEVWDGRGHLLGRSSNWQGSSALQFPPQNGFFHSDIDHRHYRLLRLAGTRIVDPGEVRGGHLRFVTILYGAPTERVWRSIYGAVEFYAAGMLLLVLITGPLIAWVLHRGLTPLRQLATLAGNISANSWTFNPPDSARETAELAPLTRALETALQRLERSFNQQRTFISDAAHELKTAVAVVKSSLQLTAMRPRTPEEYQAANERALSDAERVEALVSRMLTLARLEYTPSSFPDQSSAALHTSQRGANINACITSAVSEFETAAAVRQVAISLHPLPADPCLVPLSPEDCSLVFGNLLLNAIQHSAPQSHVEIRATQNEDSVEITVQDHGEGIDPVDLPNVFDRFYRADPSRARSTGGTGLGLAICKAAVERAGGTISLSSDLGKGTTARIQFRNSSRSDN